MAKLKKKATSLKVKKADKLLGEIKLQIEQARQQVAIVVNQSLTNLYWNIGGLIHHHILEGNRAEYGKEILATVSPKLSWSHFIELITLEEETQREEASKRKR